ncbi:MULTISPECIES: hypothetical protein [unclassified Lysinibacillus]|uniref:hypothetical protein n=1 Tax=unclassified Lysinibacillus TaxID=2636778 RepID=UPI00143DFFC8|nr:MULTISPECIES: hypothetical protein [unclassified Lysinibacillus]
MQKKRDDKKEREKEEFGIDLSPDDLDIREENDLTEEQYKNSNQVKQSDNSRNKK